MGTDEKKDSPLGIMTGFARDFVRGAAHYYLGMALREPAKAANTLAREIVNLQRQALKGAASDCCAACRAKINKQIEMCDALEKALTDDG